MDGEAGWWTTIGKIGLGFPPLARVMEWVDNNKCINKFHKIISLNEDATIMLLFIGNML